MIRIRGPARSGRRRPPWRVRQLPAGATAGEDDRQGCRRRGTESLRSNPPPTPETLTRKLTFIAVPLPCAASVSMMPVALCATGLTPTGKRFHDAPSVPVRIARPSGLGGERGTPPVCGLGGRGAFLAGCAGLPDRRPDCRAWPA